MFIFPHKIITVTFSNTADVLVKNKKNKKKQQQKTRIYVEVISCCSSLRCFSFVCPFVCLLYDYSSLISFDLTSAGIERGGRGGDIVIETL